MKILLITASPLRADNSTGNTYINLFSDMNDIQFSNIYCKSQNPDNDFVTRYLKITEKQIIRRILNPKAQTGEMFSQIPPSAKPQQETNIFIRKHQWRIFFLAKDILWKIGVWKNNNLKNFLDECNPDIIFAPLFSETSLNDLILFSQKHLGCKLITYGWDDEYTLNQFSVSPMYWINRLYQRIALRKVARLSDIIYVISDKQKEVYDKCFNKNCKILTKGEIFNVKPETGANKITKIVYTGNLGYTRWKSLVVLANALKKFNKDSLKAQLYIYSQTPLKKNIIDSLNLDDSSFFMGKVSHTEAIKQQKEADILLHVESFKKKARKGVKLSFSTKLVDYFHQAKCIFAIGPEDVASIDYLIKNDAAITATSEKEIEEKLKMIIENPAILTDYGNKAWECGRKNHQIDDIQSKLRKDFEELIS